VELLPKKDVTSVEMSLIAHATEDRDRVQAAARTLLPPDRVDEVAITRKNLKGEYGNLIILHSTIIRDPDIAEALLRNIGLKLSSLDKETLSEELELRLKKGNLYLRLDKQAAFKGNIRLCRSDPMRLRVRFRTSKSEEIREICRMLGVLP
jgi:RNA binding exosome subunit